MGFFKRVSDIISANPNDMVEDPEDPEAMLRQVVREMEDAVRKAKPDVAKAMANEKTLDKELRHNERQVETWAQHAVKAVGEGDDMLGRKALQRKREYERLVAALGDQHKSAEETVATLRRQLEGMQSKLNEAKRRLGTLAARKRAADVRSKAAQSEFGATIEHDAFDKFDRLSRRVELAEAEAEAMSELAKSETERQFGAPDSELESDRPDDLEIEAELMALKRKADSSDA